MDDPNLTSEEWEARLLEYSLGTMGADAAEFERELEVYRGRLAMADQYIQTVGWLGASVSPAEPPAGHKARFMARVASTPQLVTGVASTAEASAPTGPAIVAPPAYIGDVTRNMPPIIDLAERRSRRSLAFTAFASAAAAAVLILGLWGWGNATRLQNERDTAIAQLAELSGRVTIPEEAVQFAVAGQDPQPASFAMSLVDPDTNEVWVFAENLQALPEDMVYELWWLPAGAGETPVPAGVFRPSEGGSARHSARAPGPLTDYSGVAVTVERAPGVDTPQGPIVLLGNYDIR